MDLEFNQKNFLAISNQIKSGKLIVMPTDTVYGFSGDPNQNKVITKIQNLKGRVEDKPFLLLLGNIEEVKKLVDIDDKIRKLLEKIWPGPCTIILKRKSGKLEKYFPREKYLAIRIPKNKLLLEFLNKYWKKPLISTSVNISGKKPENDLKKIKKLFGKNEGIVYCDEVKNKQGDGEFKSSSSNISTIIKIENGKIKLIREGILPKNNIETLARQIFNK